MSHLTRYPEAILGARVLAVPRDWQQVANELLEPLARPAELDDPPPPEPVTLLARWLAEARSAGHSPNPEAMALATVGPDGRPDVRIVLCKQMDAQLGAVSFFTNYRSRKARQLDATCYATGLFHWDQARRQARVSGPVVRLARADSESYFRTRPPQAQLGAWVSDQSEPISSRAALRAKIEAAVVAIRQGRIPLEAGGDALGCPAHWGGYRLWLERVELWTGGAGRVHDRIEWTRPVRLISGVATPELGPWSALRLQP